MPEICRFYGIIVTMFYEDHNPPHIHVRYGDYRALITLEDGVVTGTLPRRALNMIFEWIDLHKDELMDNWRRMENEEILKSIEPLK